MTDTERIKSILAEIEYDFISYDNLYNDDSHGLKLIEKALRKELKKQHHCEECKHLVNRFRGSRNALYGDCELHALWRARRTGRNVACSWFEQEVE